MPFYYIVTNFILPICVFIFGVLNTKFKFHKRQAWIIIGIFIIINAFLAASRPLDSPDTAGYKHLFDNSNHINSLFSRGRVTVLFANRSYYSVEVGYLFFIQLIHRLFGSFEVYLFLSSVLVSVFTIVGGYNLCVYYLDLQDNQSKTEFVQNGLLMMYAVFTLYCGVLYTQVVIRAGLGISLCVYAVSNLMLKKQRVLSYILIIISILFHTSCITYILIYLFLKYAIVHLSRKLTIILWLISLTGYFLNIGKYTTETAINWLLLLFRILNINAFSSYITELNYTVQMREGFILFFTGVLLIISYEDSIKYSRIAIVILIGLFLYTFAYPIHALSRIVDLFAIFIIIFPTCKLHLYNKYDITTLNIILLQFVPVFLLIPQNVMIFNSLLN